MSIALPLLAERFLGVYLVVLGLSHVLAARLWASAFTEVLTRPWAGLLIGAATLPVGLAIVLVHNIWVAHFAVLTTIVGWAWTIKGSLYLLAPATPAVVSRGLLTPRNFAIAGAALTILGGVITFAAFAP